MALLTFYRYFYIYFITFAVTCRKELFSHIFSIIWRNTQLVSDGVGNVVDLTVNENVDVIFGSPSSRGTYVTFEKRSFTLHTCRHTLQIFTVLYTIFVIIADAAAVVVVVSQCLFLICNFNFKCWSD